MSVGDHRRHDKPSGGNDFSPDHKRWIARPRTLDCGRRGWTKTDSRIVAGMAEHEEQCLAARFQFFQGVVHQPGARPATLTVRPDSKGRQHRGLQPAAISLLQPHPREDDVSDGSTRILGKPLSQDAALGSKRVEKRRRLLGSCGHESVMDQLARRSMIVNANSAKSNFHHCPRVRVTAATTMHNEHRS